MAGKVKDLVESLKGPVSKELHTRESKNKVKYIPHDYHGEEEPTAPKGEGTDSEGKPKALHLSMADEPEAVDNPEEEKAEA